MQDSLSYPSPLSRTYAEHAIPLINYIYSLHFLLYYLFFFPKNIFILLSGTMHRSSFFFSLVLTFAFMIHAAAYKNTKLRSLTEEFCPFWATVALQHGSGSRSGPSSYRNIKSWFKAHHKHNHSELQPYNSIYILYIYIRYDDVTSC